MLVIGSRGSKLALWQANHIQAKLAAIGVETRIEVITTTGDRFQSGPLKEIGNKGLFTKEIEDALLDGRVDLAVHSLKDMPTELPSGRVLSSNEDAESPQETRPSTSNGLASKKARNIQRVLQDIECQQTQVTRQRPGSLVRFFAPWMTARSQEVRHERRPSRPALVVERVALLLGEHHGASVADAAAHDGHRIGGC